MATVVQRVDRLEDVLEAFVTNVGIEFNKLYNSQMRTEAKRRAFRAELREHNREMNRKWGDMASKLGTMVEDLVIPSLPRIVEQRFGGPVLDLMPGRQRRLADGRVKEFDCVAVTADLAVLTSTKASLHSADIDRFVEDIAVFREFFPKYADRPLIGVLASLAVEDGVLSYAERQGFLVLAIGDQLMEVKNRPGFEPKRW
ncbi:MAG: hypothetical protein MUC77_17580 [Chromatiaceae bacterium]|jgi:hypothetical protein|nr:hypothetical protein [Chromatiaceae bacterium]